MKSKMILQRLFVVFGLLVLLFSLSACGGKQQGRQPSFPVTEYVSSTELFRLYVPVDWRMDEIIPGADLVIANTESALEHYRSEGALESGELVLNIGFLPLALFEEQALAHLKIQTEASPEVFLQSILPMFLVDGEPAADVAGKAVLVSLGDGRDAGMLTFSKEGRDGLIMVFTAGKDVFAFVSAATYPGGLGEFQET
ncbi:MAG: hypothetical protein OEV08_11440, partial [Nitrospira sp.]|nr:hypothetical protein [Nitrospira sp.]